MAQAYIFRQCITLRNGKRICMPPGKAFRIPVNDNEPAPKPSNDDGAKDTDSKAS